MVRAQGIGEHSRDEVIGFAKADLTALSDYLGNKPYFMGERPTEMTRPSMAF